VKKFTECPNDRFGLLERREMAAIKNDLKAGVRSVYKSNAKHGNYFSFVSEVSLPNTDERIARSTASLLAEQVLCYLRLRPGEISLHGIAR